VANLSNLSKLVNFIVEVDKKNFSVFFKATQCITQSHLRRVQNTTVIVIKYSKLLLSASWGIQ